MTGWVRYVKAGVLGLAVGGLVTGAMAQPPALASDSDAADGLAMPAEFDQSRRCDGRMSPQARQLLRQHIEDAARELYKR